MATVLLLHSARGLTPGVTARAEQVRALGFQVAAPDFFGVTHDSSDAAMAGLQEYGADAQRRVDETYAALTGPVVVLGFSWGARQAGRLARVGDRVVGALLAAGGARSQDPVGAAWRADVPLALHHAVADPFVDSEALAALVHEAATNGADVSDYVYPGSEHLFMDESVPDEYDPACAALFAARVEGFLSRFA